MENHKKNIKESYAKASSGCGCSCNCNQYSNEDIAKSIGYSEEEIKSVPEANLGLGCGNPTALGEINENMTVLDLGSGGGFDCLIAAKKAKKVIGVDMTKEMVDKARENAKDYENVEFRHGEIEDLPVDSNSIDVIISNCVINLSQDKEAVLREANRVLKKDGFIFISDIVLLEELTTEERNDPELIASCVGGAVLRDEFINMVKKAGFEITYVSDDTGISERQYNSLPVESIKITARRNNNEN